MLVFLTWTLLIKVDLTAQVLEGHTGSVECLAVLPDGTLVRART